MKCVAYIRVSSESQVEKGDSLDGQKYHIDKWCKEQGYEIVNYYEDAGYSAYSGKEGLVLRGCSNLYRVRISMKK
ncbi:recombinase family protein [Vibrio splendidus]